MKLISVRVQRLILWFRIRHAQRALDRALATRAAYFLHHLGERD